MVAIFGIKLSHLLLCLLVISYLPPLGYKLHKIRGTLSIFFYGSTFSTQNNVWHIVDAQ